MVRALRRLRYKRFTVSRRVSQILEEML
ncbi:hypothetical protein BKM09_015685 [Pseudomonas amygdali pv. morsprunorum]|nr:hypothetical protein BKM19_003605 [Pseudomonas amygdali pv. morsprunorum]AXH58397.1 hypothetical protein PLA107_026455 [Pseudomonas amygdali pv. lachrymans str. M301315]KAA3546711.1 hypothetical protein DXU85_06755 [Pseudomonas savastanoi]PWD00656.1 hypothetical protein CX658_22010 [Pseudomonas amygdali pv. lachrymans]PYD21593.1 hypothetical protein DND36_18110 [Pseudomonas savastanoi pv. glycinea]QDW03310.1 hypothetical protein FFH21_001835 [Pseudomonas sp. KBS0707]TSC37321.1 hypothetical